MTPKKLEANNYFPTNIVLPQEHHLHNRKEIKCGEYVAVTKEVNPLAAIFAENFARNGKNLTIEELDKLVKFPK